MEEEAAVAPGPLAEVMEEGQEESAEVDPPEAPMVHPTESVDLTPLVFL